MFIDNDYYVIYRILKTCDPIIEDYDKRLVGRKALKTLKTQPNKGLIR